MSIVGYGQFVYKLATMLWAQVVRMQYRDMIFLYPGTIWSFYGDSVKWSLVAYDKYRKSLRKIVLKFSQLELLRNLGFRVSDAHIPFCIRRSERPSSTYLSEDGNCNGCRNVRQLSTFGVADVRKPSVTVFETLDIYSTSHGNYMRRLHCVNFCLFLFRVSGLLFRKLM
jgi:hypothetical protein